MILLICILFLLTAFFSAAETVFIGVSPAKMYKLKMEGSRRATMVVNLLKEKEKLISITLLCFNVATIGFSSVSTALALRHFGNNDLVLGAVTFTLTFVLLIFAEIMPKTYVLRHPESFSLRVAPIFVVLVRVLAPVNLVVQWLVNAMLYLLGSGKENIEHILAADAIRGTIELHHEEGTVVKDERDMLGSILDLEQIEVGQVMVHRKDLATLDASSSVEVVNERMLAGAYTRMPVWQNNPDNIIGVLHHKNLIQAMHNYQDNLESLDIRSILTKPWFIPETTTLMEQLQAFRGQHSHMAFVVDEYGALLGMVTLEDILEEIVGQIDDEYDAHTQQIRPNKDGSYTVDGRLSLRDLNRELGWNIPDTNASTVAGLVVNEAQLIPDAGQIFHFHGYRFEILKRKRNQIVSVRVRPFTEEMRVDEANA